MGSWLEPKSMRWAGLARRRKNPSLTWIGLGINGDIQAERDLGSGEAKIQALPNNINMDQIGLIYQILTHTKKYVLHFCPTITHVHYFYNIYLRQSVESSLKLEQA